MTPIAGPQERPKSATSRRQTGPNRPPKDPYMPPSAAPQAAEATQPCTPGTLSKGALEWFERRGISQPTLERNKVTVRKVWFPQTQDERLAFCFPYYRDGELVNVKYRGKSDQGRQDI